MELHLRHLFLGVTASLALHAAAAEFLPDSAPPGAVGAGEGGLLISMRAGGAPGVQAVSLEETPEEAVEPAQELRSDEPAPEAITEAIEEPAPDKPPLEESETAIFEEAPVTEEIPAEPDAAAVASQPRNATTEAAQSAAMPEAINRQEDKPVEETTPPALEPQPEPHTAWTAQPPAPRPRDLEAAEPARQTARLPDAGEAVQTGEAAPQGGQTGNDGKSESAGGLAGVPDSYLSELMAWLARHKSYPERARRRRQEGTVTLNFVVAPDGTVTAQRIADSSGHRLLDEAAEEMLRRAAPLPAFPPGMERAALPLTVPVVFQLQ